MSTRKRKAPASPGTVPPKRKRATLPKWAERELDASADRYIRRWAKGLLLTIDGEVRKLTPEEVESMVVGSRPKRARKRSSRTKK